MPQHSPSPKNPHKDTFCPLACLDLKLWSFLCCKRLRPVDICCYDRREPVSPYNFNGSHTFFPKIRSGDGSINLHSRQLNFIKCNYHLWADNKLTVWRWMTWQLTRSQAQTSLWLQILAESIKWLQGFDFNLLKWLMMNNMNAFWDGCSVKGSVIYPERKQHATAALCKQSHAIKSFGCRAINAFW